MYPWQNDNSSSYPNIIANYNRLLFLLSLFTHWNINSSKSMVFG